MPATFKNAIAVVIGLMVGGFVNFNLVIIGNRLVPAPAGMDPSNLQSIKDHMPEFTLANFMVPFAAHALGTLVAAIIITKMAATYHFRLCLIPGMFFLFGGISVIMAVPSPTWFTILDLGFAYIPMAWLGYHLAK